MREHDELIASLSRDLKPVSPAPNVNGLAMVWFLLSAGFVVVMTHLVGPIRPGAFSQLVSEPRFLLETLLGVAAIIWTSLVAFRAAIPAALNRTFGTIGFVLMVLWLAQYVFGLIDPALEPSMLGKRDYCYLETMAYSLPLILAALLLVRRLYPLHYLRTAMTLSLAAGMLPALYMQLACMYEPSHILRLHVLPGLAMVLIGAVVARFWRLKRNPPL
jgi:hypothetical protein